MVSDPWVTFRGLSIKSLKYDWNLNADLSGLGIWCGSLLRRTWDSFSLGSLRCSVALRASKSLKLSCMSPFHILLRAWCLCCTLKIYSPIQSCKGLDVFVHLLKVWSVLYVKWIIKLMKKWVMVCSSFYAAFYCSYFMAFLHSILFLNIGIIITSSLVTRFLLLIFVQISNNLTCSIILSWCPYLFCAYSEKKWKIKPTVLVMKGWR